jgi:hypothetical protein
MNSLSPFYVVYPLSVAWAIGRYNLFDVDRYLRLGVVYAALTLVFLAGYAGLVVGLERWSGAERRLPAGAVPLYLFTVVLLLDPLRSRLQSVVDRLFYRRVYSYRATVEATSRALASILDSDRIGAVVLETLTDVMAIEWGALAVVDESGEVSRVYARPAPRGAVLESGMAAQPATTATPCNASACGPGDQPWRPSESTTRTPRHVRSRGAGAGEVRGEGDRPAGARRTPVGRASAARIRPGADAGQPGGAGAGERARLRGDPADAAGLRRRTIGGGASCRRRRTAFATRSPASRVVHRWRTKSRRTSLRCARVRYHHRRGRPPRIARANLADFAPPVRADSPPST